MHQSQIMDYSRQLFDQLGPKAIAVAAQRAQDHDAKGLVAEAADWRRIETALKEMRGPRET